MRPWPTVPPSFSYNLLDVCHSKPRALPYCLRRIRGTIGVRDAGNRGQGQHIKLRLDGPPRAGLPVCLYADLQSPLEARYPFAEDPRYFGSNRLELRCVSVAGFSLRKRGGSR